VSAPGYIPFRERPTRFAGVLEHAGYRLRLHDVWCEGDVHDEERFAAGLAAALEQLPTPAVQSGRPGVGFVIRHQGATGDYLILCWWDNENELPTRVWVQRDEGWRPGNERESFCVWDLQILWQERNRYLATVLAGARGGGTAAYLRQDAEPPASR